jgi:hypothetical protein
VVFPSRARAVSHAWRVRVASAVRLVRPVRGRASPLRVSARSGLASAPSRDDPGGDHVAAGGRELCPADAVAARFFLMAMYVAARASGCWAQVTVNRPASTSWPGERGVW